MTKRKAMYEEITHEVAVYWCISCRELIGPDLSEDVGAEMAIGDHKGHLCKFVDKWTETEEVKVRGEPA